MTAPATTAALEPGRRSHERPLNVHATGIILGDRGVMITGPSGSGKSTLALALMTLARQRGLFARLIADDRLDLVVRPPRLIAAAPAAIAGLIEVRGHGPRKAGFEPRCVIDLVVRMVPQAAAPRVDERGNLDVLGCDLRHVDLAEHCPLAAEAVLAALDLSVV